MVLFPILGVCYFAIAEITLQVKTVASASQIAQATELDTHASALVHELQKERGFAAAFVGSNGEKFAESLQQQQEITNQFRESFQTTLNSVESNQFGAEFKDVLNEALRLLNQLQEKRNAIAALQLSGEEIIGYYTTTNGLFLKTIEKIVKLSKDGESTALLIAYASFLQAKEHSGQERAVLANVFAQDQFQGNLLQKLVSLITIQATYTQTFLALANEEQIQYYRNIARDPIFQATETMRTMALEKANVGRFGIQADDWIEAQTAKINLLKKVEDQLSQDLVARSWSIANHARNTLALYLAGIVLLFAVFIALGVVLGKDILSSISKVVQTFSLMSQGHLEQRLDMKRKDEIGMMGQALDAFAEELQSAMAQIVDSSQQINTAATQVSHASQTLMEGSSNQANAIEEIATSITEISSQNEHNAENAMQASTLVDDAQKVADQGHQQMKDMLQSITSIEKASQSISKIIKVIDEIAFQTNLLALNAAVEAARAGIHGKGFAVVANEVRNLAVRSAKAATETTELIENTVQTIKGGMSTAHQTAKAFDEIVSDIQKITALSAQIETASKAQANGTLQVQQTLHQIEQVTQAHSVVSEENFNQATTMQTHAKNLREFLRKFKLQQNEESMPPLPALPLDSAMGAPPEKVPPPGKVMRDEGELNQF